MNLRFLVLGFFLVAAPAQAEGRRQARPDGASNAPIGGWCDALTGRKKEQCLRDERRKPEPKARSGGRSAEVEVAPRPAGRRRAAAEAL
jgi:hypothetical protein